MIYFDGKGMKQHFGIGIALYIIYRFIELFNNRLLLMNRGDLVKPCCKILFRISDGEFVSRKTDMHALLQQMNKIEQELFLLFPAKLTDLFDPFYLRRRAAFQDSVQPFTQ